MVFLYTELCFLLEAKKENVIAFSGLLLCVAYVFQLLDVSILVYKIFAFHNHTPAATLGTR